MKQNETKQNKARIIQYVELFHHTNYITELSDVAVRRFYFILRSSNAFFFKKKKKKKKIFAHLSRI